jgi:hypothetical protein
MLGLSFNVMPGLRHGDWRSKFILISQVLIGAASLLGVIAMITKQPLLLLGWAAVGQGLIVLGVACFVIVALFSQRTLVSEDFNAGEVIFNEGDPGRDVYVVKSGTVQVLVKGRDGGHELISTLGPGDHFGEMALLRNAPRNATIRTVTPVEVYRMSPNNFAALYTSLPALREHFQKVMESRLRELDARRG